MTTIRSFNRKNNKRKKVIVSIRPSIVNNSNRSFNSTSHSLSISRCKVHQKFISSIKNLRRNNRSLAEALQATKLDLRLRNDTIINLMSEKIDLEAKLISEKALFQEKLCSIKSGLERTCRLYQDQIRIMSETLTLCTDEESLSTPQSDRSDQNATTDNNKGRDSNHQTMRDKTLEVKQVSTNRDIGRVINMSDIEEENSFIDSNSEMSYEESSDESDIGYSTKGPMTGSKLSHISLRSNSKVRSGVLSPFSSPLTTNSRHVSKQVADEMTEESFKYMDEIDVNEKISDMETEFKFFRSKSKNNESNLQSPHNFEANTSIYNLSNLEKSETIAKENLVPNETDESHDRWRNHNNLEDHKLANGTNLTTNLVNYSSSNHSFDEAESSQKYTTVKNERGKIEKCEDDIPKPMKAKKRKPRGSSKNKQEIKIDKKLKSGKINIKTEPASPLKDISPNYDNVSMASESRLDLNTLFDINLDSKENILKAIGHSPVNTRPCRKAKPSNLKEPSIMKKLRRT